MMCGFNDYYSNVKKKKNVFLFFEIFNKTTINNGNTFQKYRRNRIENLRTLVINDKIQTLHVIRVLVNLLTPSILLIRVQIVVSLNGYTYVRGRLVENDGPTSPYNSLRSYEINTYNNCRNWVMNSNSIQPHAVITNAFAVTRIAEDVSNGPLKRQKQSHVFLRCYLTVTLSLSTRCRRVISPTHDNTTILFVYFESTVTLDM